MKTIQNTSIAIVALASTLIACDKDDRRADSAEYGARNDAVQAVGTTGTAGHHAADHQTAPSVALGTVPTSTMGGTGTMGGATDGDKREAEAEFKSVPEMKIAGEAELDEVEGGVRIVVEVKNALAGQKGIHIHQTDNCSDIANKSMGEHFAPTTPKHGLPGAPPHHLGDLGNITIDKDGNGKLDITVAGANLKPNDPLSFIGKSIVIHESSDKGTGASGDAGKPIACAPIRAD